MNDEFTRLLTRLSIKHGTGKLTFELDPLEEVIRDLEAMVDNCIIDADSMILFDDYADDIKDIVVLLIERIKRCEMD